jgi:hypothetical protein
MANPGRALADRIITYFGDNQPGFGRGLELDGNQSATITEDVRDLTAALLDLQVSGLMDFALGVNQHDALAQLRIGHRRPMLLTLKGWDRYEQLKQANPQSTTAFMAMKFDDAQMDRIYRDHFRPAVKAIDDYDLDTVNERPEAGLIDYRIRLQVTASRFVLADLTHENHGVYFEAGYAEGIGRPVIYTCRTDAFNPRAGHPHFDVSHHQCVKWDDPPTAEQLEALTLTIRNTLLNKN